MSKLLHNAKRNYKKLIVLLVIILLLFVLFKGFRFLLAMGILIGIGSFSTFYQYFIKSPIQFELVKLVTVCSAVAFGPVPGILVGIIASFIGKIMTGKFEADFIGTIVATIVISLLASAMASMNIVALGIIMVIVYHIIIFPIALSMGGNLGYGMIYTSSNIVFNILVFSYLGVPLLWVLKNVV